MAAHGDTKTLVDRYGLLDARKSVATAMCAVRKRHPCSREPYEIARRSRCRRARTTLQKAAVIVGAVALAGYVLGYPRLRAGDAGRRDGDTVWDGFDREGATVVVRIARRGRRGAMGHAWSCPVIRGTAAGAAMRA